VIGDQVGDYFQAREVAHEHWLRSHSSSDATGACEHVLEPHPILRTICTYPLATGACALVFARDRRDPEQGTLVEAPAEGPMPPVDECRVIGDELDENEATRLAVNHMVASRRLGRPAPVASV
jgi:hypothetical protein